MGGLKKQTPPAMVMTGVEVYHLDTRELIFYLFLGKFYTSLGVSTQHFGSICHPSFGKMSCIVVVGSCDLQGPLKGGTWHSILQ